MAKKANVFDDATFRLLDELVDIEYLSRAVDQQTRNMLSSTRTAMDEWRKQRAAAGQSASNVVGLSSCLAIVNVFGPKFSRYGYSHKSRHDEEMLKLVAELGQRAQAQTICMLYEAFEKFMKTFAPLLFYQQRNDPKWVPAERKAFHRGRPDSVKAAVRNTPPYFEEYVHYITCYNCDKLLAELSKKMPDFQESCITDWFSDLFAIYRVVSCIRHTTVHNAGQPSARSTRGLQKWDREMIDNLIAKSSLTGQDTILPTVTATAVLFEGMSGLAYCLYKVSSDLCGMAVRCPRR